MLASNCAVPLTAVLLLFELTRDYLILVPTLAAVGISYWVSSLAAPSGRTAAARRRAAAALAAAATLARRSDAALLTDWRQQLQEGSVLQDAAASAEVAAPRALALDSAALAAEALTLACAADAGCLLVRADQSLAEALAVMEEEGRGTAVVVGERGGVVGLVSSDVALARRLSEGGGAGSGDGEGGGSGAPPPR
jgi:hypothetical protein